MDAVEKGRGQPVHKGLKKKVWKLPVFISLRMPLSIDTPIPISHKCLSNKKMSLFQFMDVCRRSQAAYVSSLTV